MTALAKRPLCVDCRDTAGWIYDESGDQAIVTPCPCRSLNGSPARQRDAGLAATVDGNPAAFKAALAIIRETALAQPILSANDTRARMKIAQVPGEVVGAAFRQAAKDKVLRADSYLPSTDPATHAHPVRSWQSLIYGRTA